MKVCFQVRLPAPFSIGGPQDRVQEEVLGPPCSISARLAGPGKDLADRARADLGRQGQETAMGPGPLGPTGNQKCFASRTRSF